MQQFKVSISYSLQFCVAEIQAQPSWAILQLHMQVVRWPGGIQLVECWCRGSKMASATSGPCRAMQGRMGSVAVPTHGPPIWRPQSRLPMWGLTSPRENVSRELLEATRLILITQPWKSQKVTSVDQNQGKQLDSTSQGEEKQRICNHLQSTSVRLGDFYFLCFCSL